MPPRPAHRASLVMPERSFPSLISQTRKQRSLTTYALAEQAGVPRASVEDLELGEQVDRDDLEAICHALELAVPELLDNALVQLGALLRDRRNRAGLSRAKLGRLACLSAATLKHIETARRPPSRRTCLRLVDVQSLSLRWADVAVFGGADPPPANTTHRDPAMAALDDADLPSDPAGSAGTTEVPDPPPSSAESAESDAAALPTCPDLASAERRVLAIQIHVFASGKTTISIAPLARPSARTRRVG